MLRLKTFLLLVSPLLLVVAAAYVQWGTVGLPRCRPAPVIPETAAEPYGFPAWLRITHYVNFLFLVLLIRSGLQILMDHPRLYWNVHCTPGTEWLRLTPVEVPKDRVWTAKDDSRYLSPWIGLPGYRHTVGMARHWHFLSVLFWVGNGLVFVVLLFGTGQWRRLVPTSWQIVPDAWAVFVHYATFHLPPEPNGFYHYNALQQLAYFGVVFVLAPLAILTGPSMSPAFTARFTWYPKLPGNRQVGRSIHFLVMCAFVVFIVGARDHGGAHRVRPEHEPHRAGHGRRQPDRPVPRPGGDRRGRRAERAGQLGGVAAPAGRPARRQGDRHAGHGGSCSTAPLPRAEFRREDISPFFWVNGKMPTCDEWKALAADDFKDYRLKVYGLVENPVELSLDDLRALGKKTQITLHHCIQGWSGIAEWGGLPLAELVELVRPTPNAKAVVFYSFGEGVDSQGRAASIYDSLSIENALHPQTLLAYEMNSSRSTICTGRRCGCGSRTSSASRWSSGSRRSNSSQDVRSINQGEGGYNEDHEYFGELANI